MSAITLFFIYALGSTVAYGMALVITDAENAPKTRVGRICVCLCLAAIWPITLGYTLGEMYVNTTKR